MEISKEYQENLLNEIIIQCIIKVHQTLGPGFLESIYRRAMVIELIKQGLRVETEKEILIYYEGEEIGKHNLKLIGIDISDEAIHIARTSYPHIEFLAGNILELPFGQNYFDIVFGNFILHLFSYELRHKMLEECHRVLKQDGIAILSVASVHDPDYGIGREVEKKLLR
ncbi:MAG: GxxExxY protein [bacterium]